MQASAALLVCWVLGTLVSWCLATLRCGSCERGSSLICPNSFDMQYSVALYPYRDTQQKSLIIKCDYQTVNLNLSLLEGCQFPDVVFVKVEQCPLFNTSVAEVLNKFGVIAQEVKYLFWDQSHGVESGPQLWHLNGLGSLNLLQVQSNGFKSFPDEFLKGNGLIRKLYITGNDVETLPADFLFYTPNVRVLDLGNNNIKYLPENLFSKIPHLEVFTIQKNKLTSLPTNLFSPTPMLKNLMLGNNLLQDLGLSLVKYLRLLTTIDLYQNKLKTLHRNTFLGSSNLKTVFLQYNEISSLPSDLFHNTSIEVLNLGGNKITDVSSMLSNLPSLQNVSLFMNQISTLPRSMFNNTPNILELDLQMNTIKTIQKGALQYLSKMVVIILSKNALSEVPPKLLSGCVSLSRVFMQENNISRIPYGAFPRFSNIKKIDLSHNRLDFKEFGPNPLNSLTNLEEVYLSHNKLSSIFNDARLVFTKLKILDLRNNLITFLNDGQLVFVSKNVTLRLEDNNIGIIASSFALQHSGTEKVLRLYLAGNPLVCSCHMHLFLKIGQFKKPFGLTNKFDLLIEDAEEAHCSNSYSSNPLTLMEVDFAKVVCDFDCTEECDCKIRSEDSLLLINCSSLGLSGPPSFKPKFHQLKKNYKLSLDLSMNQYENISFLNNIFFQNLKTLNLSNNSVSILNPEILPENLASLDMRSNNLTSLSLESVRYLNETAMDLFLGGNPWSCDCELLDFHAFLRDNYEQVLDRNSIICGGLREGNNPLDELTPEELCPVLYRPLVMASIVGGLALVLVLAVLVTAAWYRHKQLLQVWLYSHGICLWAVRRPDDDHDKQYDVFVSYSFKDEEFVSKKLVPGLESNSPPYRVCLHYRDWVPGEYIQDQIVASVDASRRTLVVLSPSYLESTWAQREFKEAHLQTLRDKRNRVIVVVLGDVPEGLDGELALYVATNTYLKWGDPRFWERLRYAMPHLQRSKPPKKNQVGRLEPLRMTKPRELEAAASPDAVEMTKPAHAEISAAVNGRPFLTATGNGGPFVTATA